MFLVHVYMIQNCKWFTGLIYFTTKRLNIFHSPLLGRKLNLVCILYRNNHPGKNYVH